jgi:N-acetylglucosaminyldiphosphoundecaprenol N-acetyl-beta-D-mannosaminyltransferase
VLELIRQHNPDVLIVGMGMPRQERWLLANHDKLAAPVLLTSGAAIDYVAGEIPTPPRWLGPLGLEWLYRLASEPRRLWRRYLLEPWFAVALFVRDLWRLRKGA